MLLLCVWPPDPLSNVCLSVFWDPTYLFAAVWKKVGGAPVRIKTLVFWQLHLLLKGSYDTSTMSLLWTARGAWVSYLNMLRIGAAFDTRKSCHGSVWLFQYKKKEIDFVVRYKLYHSLPIQFLKGGQKHFEEIKWHRNNLPACIHYTMPNCISCALGLQHCDLLASS